LKVAGALVEVTADRNRHVALVAHLFAYTVICFYDVKR
jgi:hypothetical protein